MCVIKWEEFWYEGVEWEDGDDDFCLDLLKNKVMYWLIMMVGLLLMGCKLEGKKGDC